MERERIAFGWCQQCSLIWIPSRGSWLCTSLLLCPVTWATGEARVHAASRRPGRAPKPSKWPNYLKGTHCFVLCVADNDKFVDPPCKLPSSWQQQPAGNVFAQTCLWSFCPSRRGADVRTLLQVVWKLTRLVISLCLFTTFAEFVWLLLI